MNKAALLEQELRHENNLAINKNVETLKYLRDKAISAGKLGDAQSYARKIDQLRSRFKTEK